VARKVPPGGDGFGQLLFGAWRLAEGAGRRAVYGQFSPSGV